MRKWSEIRAEAEDLSAGKTIVERAIVYLVVLTPAWLDDWITKKFGILDTVLTRMARKHFKFLIKEYNFTFEEPNWSGVVYSSPVCRVEIDQEFNRILITIFRPGDPRNNQLMLSLDSIVGFKSQQPITTSVIGDMPGFYQDREGTIDRKLAEMSSLLRLYADDFLRGDYSQAPGVVSYSHARSEMRREELRRQDQEREQRDREANGPSAS